MPFADYARSIPRAYPEKLSEKSKPKKKFYEYRPIFNRIGTGRWEIIGDTPNRTNLVVCISHHTSYTGNAVNLERRYLVELPE